MTARYPLVLNGTSIQELQSGDTLPAITLASPTLTSPTLTSPTLTTPYLTASAWPVVDKGNVSNATVTFDYSAGSVQTFTATGSTVTWAFSNWPTTGNLGELLIIATNAGAYTQTISGVTWIQPSGATTTTFSTYLANNGTRTTLQSSGTDQFYFWTRDAGTTIYGKLI